MVTKIIIEDWYRFKVLIVPTTFFQVLSLRKKPDVAKERSSPNFVRRVSPAYLMHVIH